MRWLAATFLLAVTVCTAFAEKPRKVRVECPLCEDRFTYRQVLQEWRSGLRLDFKQFGNPHSPTELPECPKCGLVLPDGGKNELSRADIAALTELLKTDRYKIALNETSYFRLAVVLEALGRSPDEVAFAYLAASWQVDDNPNRCQVYLARSLSWYESYLDHPGPSNPARTRALLLRAELLRRLGRFEEASERLADLTFHPSMAHSAEQNIIHQQKELVAIRDDEPHVAIADDARVDVVMRVTTPGSRFLRPALTPDARLPAYPSGPYASRLGGSVTLQLSVTRSGYVVACQVKSATAEAFARSAMTSVRDWTFDPKVFDAVSASPVQLECIVYFALEG